MRVLVIVPDCFGGRGGIARYFQDIVSAWAKTHENDTFVVYPRSIADAPGALPANVQQSSAGVGSKLRFAWALARAFVTEPWPDVVVVGHINLLPFAAPFRFTSRLVLVLHGEEVWTPPGRFVAEQTVALLTACIAVSHVTVARFAAWSGVRPSAIHVLSCGVDLSAYGPGPKPSYLVTRYGLAGRRVILTLGRLAQNEKKGFDVMLDVLPALRAKVPNVAWVVCGDGDDRARLEEKARRLGVSDIALFTGYVPDHEKADHYRLADAFALPSQGEGFGIVLLEALASGLPVLGSTRDATREVLQDGELGVVVDPLDENDVLEGLLKLLERPRGQVPEALNEHGYAALQARASSVLDSISGR